MPEEDLAVAPPVITARRGATFVVTLNRPERRNALTPEAYVRLAEAWYEFRDDPELRVAILTGAGEQAFTVGADLRTSVPLLSGARAPQDEWDERFLADLSLMNDALLRDLELTKPVIAAVNGDAVGAGAEILQATDLRVAADHATFALPEVKRGLIPGGGSITRLVRQIPWAVAAEMMLLGAPIDADRAKRIGLVNDVVPASELMVRAHEYADAVAANAPLAVGAVKQGMLAGSGLPLTESLAIERRLVARIFRTADAQEGARAFVEKRAPDFRGE